MKSRSAELLDNRQKLRQHYENEPEIECQMPVERATADDVAGHARVSRATVARGFSRVHGVKDHSRQCCLKATI